MNLLDYELLPGMVASVEDEEHLGRIKVTIPGAEIPGQNIRMEAAPWCLPFTMTGTYQGFTKLMVNSKVWVLRNRHNSYEMWYIPYFELNDNTAEVIENYDNCDVLVSRNMGGNNVYIYYTDNKGIVLSVGNSQINISSDGKIIINDENNGNITLSSGSIYLNTNSEKHQCVRSDILIDALKNYAAAITEAIGTVRYGESARIVADDAAKALNSAIAKNNLCSSNIYIS